ncbi:hypothetical protein T01_8803 [Trichinella spiralis]|uniref:Uncharacterized protein n=1 Tax=Trichinella spiralis TaxID=6334 RepID=A0A0V1B6D7_TRISP|nr:hypothetical protein T01_8803 [Trichinella spiralis]
MASSSAMFICWASSGLSHATSSTTEPPISNATPTACELASTQTLASFNIYYFLFTSSAAGRVVLVHHQRCLLDQISQLATFNHFVPARCGIVGLSFDVGCRYP